MKTLSEILIEVNSYLDLTAELPTADDLTVRSNFANQAVSEWASSYKWKQLDQITVTTASFASLSLATNFREFTSVPTIETIEYPEVTQSEVLSQPSGERYTYVTGGVKNYVVNISPFTEPKTISFSWQRYPSYMATTSSVCEVPDSDFVRLKVISNVLQSRLDERFPSVEAEAKRTLSNMIGREMTKTPGGSPSSRRYGSAAWGLGRRNG